MATHWSPRALHSSQVKKSDFQGACPLCGFFVYRKIGGLFSLKGVTNVARARCPFAAKPISFPFRLISTPQSTLQVPWRIPSFFAN